MEAVVEKKSEGQINVPSLNAEVVNQVLSTAEDRSATTTCSVEVKIYEQFGRAFISWNVSFNFAIGIDDKVQLREGLTATGDWPIGGRSGSQDTGRTWGSGLNASYWAMNYINGKATNNWMQLAVTPNT